MAAHAVGGMGSGASRASRGGTGNDEQQGEAGS